MINGKIIVLNGTSSSGKNSLVHAFQEQRERSRRNRTLGQAILQFEVFHRQGTYDLEVDTTRLGPQDCARLVQARLLEPPCSFASLRRGML